MNKKILAAVFSMALLCSCGNGNAEEQSETGSESVSLASGSASETTVTTTAAETTSEAVSEETEIVSEVSETEEKVPITRNFFNDNVVFEEVMLPVKVTYYKKGIVDNIIKYEYDAAGNESKYQAFIHEYDYNLDGTYNSNTTLFMNEIIHINRFDENGYCIESTSYGTATNYEYEFDDAKRLIRKTEIHGDEKESFEYTYDKEGRLYEEINNTGYMNYSRLRHEYDGSIESIYYSRYDLEEGLWKIMERNENGNIIKETVDIGFINNSNYVKGKLFTEYKYDSLNRLIYENHTVSDDYLYEDSNKANVYSYTYEYDGDNLKKKTTCNIHQDGTSEYWSNTETTEYFYDKNGMTIKEVYISKYDPHDEYPTRYTTEYSYNEDGTIISRTHNMEGTLTNETEYAMIPKIKTDIEYKHYVDVNP